MRRDRTGELVDEDEHQADEHQLPHRCRNGWIDRDSDHPRPCLTCKPHLAHRYQDTNQGRTEAQP